MNQLGFRIPEFLVFFHMPLFVETIVLEWKGIEVCLVVTLTVDVFERMRARFALFGFETGRVDLEISLVTPSKVVVMFGFVRTVAFQISSILKSACKDYMPPLLAVFALQNTRVHVSTVNGSDKVTNVEVAIDKLLGY